MNKKDIYKLTPGSWLEILWLDASPEVGMLIEKPEHCKGDVSLHMFYPHRKLNHVDSHAVHSQISNVLGSTWPVPISTEDRRLEVPVKIKKSK